MAKKKSSSSFGPRLKACKQCGEANAPRQFYCKSCNTPFYSEEYMNSRISTPPSTPEEVDSGFSPNVEEGRPRKEVVEYMLSRLSDSRVEFFPHENEIDETGNFSRKIEISGTLNKEIHVNACESIQVDHDNAIANTGGDSVQSISSNSDIIAVLIDSSKIQFWNTHAKFLGDLKFSSSSQILKIKWIKWSSSDKLFGLIAIVTLTNVQVHLVPRFTREFSLRENSTLLWASEVYFPNNLDGRIGDNNRIEVITSNNMNNFIHLFVLKIEEDNNLNLSLVKVYAYNAPGRRVSDDSESGATSTSTCCAFLGNRYFFYAGLSDGSILLWDMRDDHGPREVIQTLAGIRRWLVELRVPADYNSMTTLLAAFQAGSIVNSEGDIQVQPIGGDVKSAQCFGIEAIKARIFTAMSSGVVITMDRSLREKLRRGMTAYVSQWAAKTDLEVIDDDATIFDKILRRRKYGEIFVKFFPKKQFPKNLKNLKASDGANNDPPPLLNSHHSSLSPLPIKCFCATESNILACGLDAGLIHFFTYTD